MLRLFPVPTIECPPETIYDDLTPPSGPQGRPAIAINIVTSVDGQAALGGGAATLGSALDHLLMRAIRAAHDAVLIGAGTLRAEPVDPRVGPRWREVRARRGQSPEPLAVLLSASGAAPLDRRYFKWPDVRRVVVVGSEAARAHEVALSAATDVLRAPTPLPDPAWIVRMLADRYGVRRLLIEGGPSVNGAFVAAGVVDEIFWTLAPTLIGSGQVTMLGGPKLPTPVGLAITSAYMHEDEWFMRYRVVPGPRGVG